LTTNSPLLWLSFNAFILAMLALDIVVFHQRPHAVRFKEALGWTAFWVALAVIFCAGVYYFRGPQAGTEFLTGYLIEESLSVDNLFVFLLIFRYFRVPAELQHGVLFWGIMGALAMRLVFILAGVALLERFHWLIYLFGGLLVFSGFHLWSGKDKEIHPDRNPLIRLFRRHTPVTQEFVGAKFFVRRDGRRFATPLLIVLIALETTDLIFAVDSIPAVLAITRDPFIVFSSNAFAVLGLRSLFFALSGIMQMFHHLHYGLSAILIFVGGKMLVADLWKVPTAISLGVVGVLLALSVAASLIWPRHEAPAEPEPRS
jgi:tellurite resistance protein TerC